MHDSISEDDLLKIFLKNEKKKHRRPKFFVWIYRIFLTLFFVVIGYIVVNFYGVSTNLTYWFKNDYSSNTTTTENVASPATPGVPTVESEAHEVPVMDNNSIAIPVIDVKAPITFGVINKASEVSAALQNGAIQINGTALPGQIGNVYITGHSSNYVWAKGNYNSVFALLDKVVVGDKIYVKYNEIVYEYEVYDQKIVTPKDTSVLQSTSDSRLTLVTCWPVGTSLKRVVLLAKQTYPDPANNSSGTTNTAQFDSLTSGR